MERMTMLQSASSLACFLKAFFFLKKKISFSFASPHAAFVFSTLEGEK